MFQLSQLGIGNVNRFAKNDSTRKAGEMSPAPECHSVAGPEQHSCS